MSDEFEVESHESTKVFAGVFLNLYFDPLPGNLFEMPRRRDLVERGHP